jgi:hypothetical protein
VILVGAQKARMQTVKDQAHEVSGGNDDSIGNWPFILSSDKELIYILSTP